MLILEMNGSQLCLERDHEWKTVTCPVNAALSQKTQEITEAEVTHGRGQVGEMPGGGASGAIGLQG